MPQRRRPLQKAEAKIRYLADAKSSGKLPNSSNQANGAIERVRKCFDRIGRAEQEPLNDHEDHDDQKKRKEQQIKVASILAYKVMTKYGLSLADVMIHEDASEREKRGGMSAVDVFPPKKGGRVFTPGWVDWLLGAVDIFFNCGSFTAREKDRVTWTFYGISECTVAAAIAAEALHNTIVDWSERFTGIQARNSYCLGVADGLLSLSEAEQKNTERQARESEAQALAAKIREEKEQEAGRLSRLQDPIPAVRYSFEARLDANGDSEDSSDRTIQGDMINVEDSNEEDQSEEGVEEDLIEDSHSAKTTIDIEADFEAELEKSIKPEPEDIDEVQRFPVRQNPEEEDEETASSMLQLTKYREASRDIEQDVLKTHNIKLLKGRKWNHIAKVKTAFEEGQKDSKKCRFKAARIEPGKDSDRVEDMMDTAE
ncbi:MAG: hypothetical protein Q9226_004793 [Calogaya cf. arnoldii]